jgi:hypothetical protein
VNFLVLYKKLCCKIRLCSFIIVRVLETRDLDRAVRVVIAFLVIAPVLLFALTFFGTSRLTIWSLFLLTGHLINQQWPTLPKKIGHNRSYVCNRRPVQIDRLDRTVTDRSCTYIFTYMTDMFYDQLVTVGQVCCWLTDRSNYWPKLINDVNINNQTYTYTVSHKIGAIH